MGNEYSDPLRHTFDCGSGYQTVIGERENVNMLKNAWDRLDQQKRAALQEKRDLLYQKDQEHTNTLTRTKNAYEKKLKDLTDAKDLTIKQKEDIIAKMKEEHSKTIKEMVDNHRKEMERKISSMKDEYNSMVAEKDRIINNKDIEIKCLKRMAEDLTEIKGNIERTAKENMDSIKGQLSRAAEANLSSFKMAAEKEMSEIKSSMFAMMSQMGELMKANANGGNGKKKDRERGSVFTATDDDSNQD